MAFFWLGKLWYWTWHAHDMKPSYKNSYTAQTARIRLRGRQLLVKCSNVLILAPWQLCWCAVDGHLGRQAPWPRMCLRSKGRNCWAFMQLLLMIEILHYLTRTLKYGNYGISLLIGNAGFLSSCSRSSSDSERLQGDKRPDI